MMEIANRPTTTIAPINAANLELPTLKTGMEFDSAKPISIKGLPYSLAVFLVELVEFVSLFSLFFVIEIATAGLILLFVAKDWESVAAASEDKEEKTAKVTLFLFSKKILLESMFKRS